MVLRARTLSASEIPEERVDAMFSLMTRHFDHVDPVLFRRDLAKKRWVILLEEEESLFGFSTLTTYEQSFEGRDLLVFFSGDTIIDRAHWGSIALPIEFMRMTRAEADARPGLAPYWLLTTKGFRTYRFLPVFLKEFHPRWDRPDDVFEGRLARALGAALFRERFDPKTGLLRASEQDQRLAPEHTDVPEGQRKDPHVAFFLERNPDFDAGDELVCVASLSRDNYKEFALKRAERRQ